MAAGAAVLFLTAATVQQMAAAVAAVEDSAVEQRKEKAVQPSLVKLALPETTAAAAVVEEWVQLGQSAQAVRGLPAALAALI